MRWPIFCWFTYSTKMVNFHVCTLKYKDQCDIWSPAHQLLTTGNLPFGNRSQNPESFKKQVQMTILCIDIHRHNKDSYLPIHYLSKLLRFYLYWVPTRTSPRFLLSALTCISPATVRGIFGNPECTITGRCYYDCVGHLLYKVSNNFKWVSKKWGLPLTYDHLVRGRTWSTSG